MEANGCLEVHHVVFEADFFDIFLSSRMPPMPSGSQPTRWAGWFGRHGNANCVSASSPSSTRSQQLASGGEALCGSALLCTLMRAGGSAEDAAVHRVLPYLAGTAGPNLQLQPTMFLDEDIFAATCAQGRAVRQILVQRLRLGSLLHARLDAEGHCAVAPAKELRASVDVHVPACTSAGAALSLLIAYNAQPLTLVEETRAILSHIYT